MKMSNSKRAKEKRNRERKGLFQEAMAEGNVSRRDICKAMSVTGLILTEFFEDNPKMYKLYAQTRRELRDIALDNVTDIVYDKNHPKNYDASKYIIQHYDTDLDVILDAKDSDNTSNINVSNSTGSGIVIKFAAPEKPKED